MREEFIKAIKSRQSTFKLSLPGDTISHLADYYELVQLHNPLLHLVGPCSPTEFATRHILESLTMLEFIPTGARFADVGSGAGLPAIPGLIVRRDLSALLIESKEKKAGFLRTALAECQLKSRAQVFDRQFSEAPKPNISFITCRALDKFTQRLPQLLKWSGDCNLLFFGGPTLREGLRQCGLNSKEKLMPLSEQRFLFIVTPPKRKTYYDRTR